VAGQQTEALVKPERELVTQLDQATGSRVEVAGDRGALQLAMNYDYMTCLS
jgi:hypothetical protein